ncbi:hypothetical protein [Cellvibrio mixtus]|uniref:hypothetical protein n=1 Tax=Cellvibrio mixtus TaxID=39650 RepID=UPI00058748E2|nr:hypothetical protein [Cellvibrio mixtus]
MNSRNRKKIEPINNNRPAEEDELNFENDQPTPGFDEPVAPPGDDPHSKNAGLTEASQPGQGPTNDDLTPETLILEDGARSQYEQEQGSLEPADKSLSVVNDNEIGAGGGLDEAELAKVDPISRRK